MLRFPFFRCSVEAGKHPKKATAMLTPGDTLPEADCQRAGACRLRILSSNNSAVATRQITPSFAHAFDGVSVRFVVLYCFAPRGIEVTQEAIPHAQDKAAV